jgi:hypothetical protein
MIIDMDYVSEWYVRLQGFRVYACCSYCQGKVLYQKARKKGYHGFAAQCRDCQRRFPVRFKHHLHQRISSTLRTNSVNDVIHINFLGLHQPKATANDN